MQTNPNDPVGPGPDPNSIHSKDAFVGLTKREHFAGLAYQGLLANPEIQREYKFDGLVEHAVECADSLIKQLNEVPDVE